MLKLNEFENELVKEIKRNFNLKEDKNVGKIACFMIERDKENKISANRKAMIIVMLKNEVNLACNCSGNCISWYKDKLKNGKLKKVESIEERKERLKKELEGIENKLKKVESIEEKKEIK
jgi:hypothetical protein